MKCSTCIQTIPCRAHSPKGSASVCVCVCVFRNDSRFSVFFPLRSWAGARVIKCLIDQMDLFVLAACVLRAHHRGSCSSIRAICRREYMRKSGVRPPPQFACCAQESQSRMSCNAEIILALCAGCVFCLNSIVIACSRADCVCIVIECRVECSRGDFCTFANTICIHRITDFGI